MFQYRHEKKPKTQPWRDEYKPLEKIQLEKYLDKEIFAADLQRWKEDREDEEERKKEREKQRVC